MEIFQEFEILRRLEFRKERYGIEKLLKELKDISIIEMDRFECKINEKIKEFTLYTGIVIDNDHGLIYDGVVIINYNYEFNFYNKGSKALDERYKSGDYVASIRI